MKKHQLPNSKVALYEYGDPSGDPLFFFHGWPGSGRQAALLDVPGQQNGFRIIAPDRPGIGGSTRLAERNLAGFPAHLAELADVLELPRFSMLGVSGGGPYVLACASRLQDRVQSGAVVCGAPPIAELQHHKTLSPLYQFLLWLFHRRPRLVRNLFAMARPFLMWRDAYQFLPPLRHLLPGPDRDILSDRDTFEKVFVCNQDAFLDVDGLFEDAALYAVPWGLRLDAISTPLHFWHGVEDSNFHWSLAEELAARLPTATLRIIPDEGHFSLPIKHGSAILAQLRTANTAMDACGAAVAV